MAQTLPANLKQVYEESLLRNPCVRVTVVDENGTEYDVSKDLLSVKIEKTVESKAAKAMLKFENKNAKYDKFNLPAEGVQLLFNSTYQTTVWDIVINSGDSQIGAATFGGTFLLSNAYTGSEIFRNTQNDSVYSVSLSNDDNTVVLGHFGEGTSIFDVYGAYLIYESKRLHGSLRAARLSPDNTFVVEVGDHIYIWESGLKNTEAGVDIADFPIYNNGTAQCVDISPNGHLFAYGTNDGSVDIREVNTDVIKHRSVESGAITSVSFSPDNTKLVVGTQNKRVVVIEVATGQKILELDMNTLDSTYYSVNDVSYSYGGDRIAVALSSTSSESPLVLVLDSMTGSVLYEYNGHNGSECLTAKFSHDDTLIASGGTDREVHFWEVPDRTEVSRYMFEENRTIKIEKGNNGEYVPAGVFLIRKVDPSKYARGEVETIEVKCFDRSKNLLKNKISTDLYEATQANEIVKDIATNYANINPAEIELAPLDFQLAKVQFIEETTWDAMSMPLEAKGYSLDFDERGVLVSHKFREYNPGVYDWEYNNADFIAWFKPSWDDDEAKNTVKVLGRDVLNPQEITGEEELLFTNTETYLAGDDGATKTHYYFEDHSREAVDVRIEWEALDELWDTSDYVQVIEKTTTYIKIKYRNKNHKTTDANFIVRCYGKPVGQAVPGIITGFASNSELVERYGEILEKVDNPLVQTQADADYLAESILQHFIWSRNKIDLEIPDNMSHQVGDIIRAYNPRYKRSLTLYIADIKQDYQVGTKDTATLSCYIIE